jgi:Bacterial Ig domain
LRSPSANRRIRVSPLRAKGIAQRVSVIAALTLLAAAAAAEAAQAAPFSMTFTEDRANVGVQLDDAPMFQAPETATLQAQIDPDTGDISDGTLTVPDFFTHVDGFDADVTVHFVIGPITGHFDKGTGALSLTGDVDGSTLDAGNGKPCGLTTDPTPLTLTTAGDSGGTNPRSGSPFSAGLNGDGAIAGQWADMTAAPVLSGPGNGQATCDTVDQHIDGAGGIWLVQDNPTDAPVCSAAGAETNFQAPVELALPCTGAFRVISIGSGPSHGALGTIDQGTGKVTYTPNAGYSGPDSFTFSAIDAGGYSQPATATIQVHEPGVSGPPPRKPHKATFGQCVKNANKAFHKALKRARHKHGKARAKAIKASRRRRAKLISKCKVRFHKEHPSSRRPRPAVLPSG